MIQPIRITDRSTGRILHAPSLIHHRGREGIRARLFGKGEGWDVMCACGSAGEALPTAQEAQRLYIRHALRATEALRSQGREIDVNDGAE